MLDPGDVDFYGVFTLMGVIVDDKTGQLSMQSVAFGVSIGLRVKMCVWLGVSRGLDLAFLNAD